MTAENSLYVQLNSDGIHFFADLLWDHILGLSRVDVVVHLSCHRRNVKRQSLKYDQPTFYEFGRIECENYQ